MKERAFTVQYQERGQLTTSRELAIRRLTRNIAQVSLQEVFSKNNIEAVSLYKGSERVVGRGDILDRSERKKKVKRGWSGGWRRKVSDHDIIKEGFGGLERGCPICDYRKAKYFIPKVRVADKAKII